MTSCFWNRLGTIMAAVAIFLGVAIAAFGSWTRSGWHLPVLSGGTILDGIQVASRLVILVVITMVLTAQRTRMGRLWGNLALLGMGLHLLLVDLWLTIPLLNTHPHLLSVFFSTGGLTAILGLIGGIGLGVTTVRYREMERWASRTLLWQRWSIIGGSIGFLVVIFLLPQTNLLTFLLLEGAFMVLPAWAFLAGTALSLLRSSLSAHALPEAPTTTP